MSDNNKESNLPGKDYFRSYKGSKKKRERQTLTDAEKQEFQQAFGDSEAEGTQDVYATQKTKLIENVAKQEPAPDYSSEDLYKLPEFNTDEFFASLSNGNKKDVKSVADVSQNTEVKSFSTATVKLPAQSTAKIPVAATEETVTFKKVKKDLSSLTDTIENTRHFGVKKPKIQPKDKKKSFAQNFRVLSKNREDMAILEAAPAGKGGKVFADSVKAKKGEGIFEAVEKAYLEKTASSNGKDAKQLKAKKKRQHYKAGLEKGEVIKAELLKQVNYAQLSVYILAVIFALSFIMTVFFTRASFYPVMSIIMLVASMAVSFKSLIKSVKSIKNLSAAADTGLLIMCFFVLFHNVSTMLLSQTAGLYTLSLIFACLARSICELYKGRSRLRYINMATKSKSLSVLQGISVKTDAVSFTKNISEDGEPNIFYCSEADLDTAVEEPAYNSTRESKYYVFSVCAVLIGSLAAGFVSFFSNKTGFDFITALTAGVCVMLPVIYDPLSRFFFFNEGKQMLGYSAAVSSREALEAINKADGFVLDASDVFTGEVSRFRKSGISHISQSDSAVFAATVLSAAGSILAPCFSSFISQMKLTLPEAENLQYEERLGYSAWVLDRKVLVGNRQMLESHSINLPSKEHEKAYGKGKFVMYVAIDGEITATFLVSYKVLASLEKYARDFNKTGLVLMICSKEAFLNEKVVANKLMVDIAAVKVLSSKATAIMEKYNDSRETQVPTGLLCSKKRRSFMHLVMGSFNMENSDKLIKGLSILGQALAFVLLIASIVFKISMVLNPVTLIILRALWAGVIMLVLKFKK